LPFAFRENRKKCPRFITSYGVWYSKIHYINAINVREGLHLCSDYVNMLDKPSLTSKRPKTASALIFRDSYAARHCISLELVFKTMFISDNICKKFWCIAVHEMFSRMEEPITTNVS
jgi:hypothetical protein